MIRFVEATDSKRAKRDLLESALDLPEVLNTMGLNVDYDTNPDAPLARYPMPLCFIESVNSSKVIINFHANSHDERNMDIKNILPLNPQKKMFVH